MQAVRQRDRRAQDVWVMPTRPGCSVRKLYPLPSYGTCRRFVLWMACWTQDEIAEEVGVPGRLQTIPVQLLAGEHREMAIRF